ncbi:MAG: Fe-S-binding domain-containing protein, partial [Acidobacteriota bacterium]
MLAPEYLLTILLIIPTLGAAVVLLLPRNSLGAIRATTLVFSLVAFFWSLPLVTGFDSAASAMQFVQNVPWIRAGGFRIAYHVGIDGISLFLVLLTTVLMPLAILGSWKVQKNLKPYMALMLLLEAGMLGVFVALDLVLFYFFWEAMLIPMYFLIG